MNREQIKEYTARVAQANRSELVVILYELVLDELDSAELSYKNGDKSAGDESMNKARAYLGELKGSLDFNYSISFSLMKLYRYVFEKMVSVTYTEKKDTFDEIRDILASLKKSFEEVAKLDNSPAVVENSQAVYAGLTYSKGSLNEVMLNGSGTSRGFQV